MIAFEIVIFLVAVTSIVIMVRLRLRSPDAHNQIGRRGTLWFDRAEDHSIESRPSEDERDAPIPQRPLRGRP